MIFHNKTLESELVDPSKLVIWTGAGIDVDQPTNLPIGNSLTCFILERYFPDKDIRLDFAESDAISDNEMNDFLKSGDTVAEALFNSRRRKLNKSFQDMNSRYDCHFPLCDNGIRLESVLEVAREFETTALKKDYSLSGKKGSNGNSGNFSILDGFKLFAQAYPNESHYDLAQLIHEGAVVVTMNYDLCIQIAYNEIYGKQLVRRKISEHMFKYQDPEGSGTLYHLHGVADTPESIGITLNTIDKPFPEEFLERIIEKTQIGCTFLFLGYACGDDFDVNDMFRRMKDRGQLSLSSAICVIYPEANNPEQKPTSAQQQMLDLFPRNDFAALKLPEFFATYYKDISDKTRGQNGRNHYQNRKGGWWKKDFVRPDPDFVPRLNDQLDYMLGISREYKKDKIQKSPKLEDWHYRFYSGYDSVKRKLEKFFAPDWEDNQKIRLSVDESIALLNQPEGRTIIYSDPKHPKISWKPVSAINHRVIENLRLYSVSSKLVDFNKCERLYNAVKEILTKNSVDEFIAPRARFVLEYDLAILTYLTQKDWAISRKMIFNTMWKYTRTSELSGLDRGVEIYMDLWKIAKRDYKKHCFARCSLT